MTNMSERIQGGMERERERRGNQKKVTAKEGGRERNNNIEEETVRPIVVGKERFREGEEPGPDTHREGCSMGGRKRRERYMEVERERVENFREGVIERPRVSDTKRERYREKGCVGGRERGREEVRESGRPREIQKGRKRETQS